VIGSRDLDADHQTFKVTRKQQVAAAAKDEAWQRLPLWVGQQFAQVIRPADANEAGRAHVDTEGVVWRQADVAFDGELHRVILGASE